MDHKDYKIRDKRDREVEQEISTVQSNSPAEMIKIAVAAGTDLDKLEKLLNLQERYEANQAKKAYHVAMAAFKANPPEIDKDKQVSYGNTNYKHASLANVTKKINAALSEHGLSASWRIKQNGDIIVTCKITHAMGHSEETSIPAKADTSGSKNSIQAIGSTITYLERYTLLALTGLATHDGDDDGRSAATEYITEAEGNEILDKLNGAKINLVKFLEYMNVEKLESINRKDFKKAMKAVQNAIENATTAKKGAK